jgi:hypothetical protein
LVHYSPSGMNVKKLIKWFFLPTYHIFITLYP